MTPNISNVVASNSRPQPTKAVQSKVPEVGKKLPPKGNEEPSPSSAANLEKSVEQISQFMAENSRGLVFRVDEASGKTVVTVVNRSSGEVIRQIPSEEMLQIAANFRRLGELHFVDTEI